MNAIDRRTFLAGAAAVTMAGCSPSRQADTVRVAFSPTTLMPVYREIALAFERRHPGLRVELMPAVDPSDVMQRDFRLALVDKEPDVSHVGINHVRFYRERQLAQPLSPLLGPGAMSELTTHPQIGYVEGVLVALPFALSVPVSYVNATLVARSGLDPAQLLQGDWPDLLQVAAQVSRLGGPLSGIYFDIYASSGLAWQTLVSSRGGHLMSPDDRDLAFDGEAGLWSARLLAALGRAGQRDMSRDAARTAFTAGQIGLYQNTSATLQRFRRDTRKFELAVAPLPRAQDGRLVASGNAALIVTRDPRRLERAAQYIHFACGPEGQTLMARSTGYLSTNRTALGDPKRLLPLIEGDQVYQRLYAEIECLAPWFAFPGPRSEQIAAELTQIMRRIVVGLTPAEAALQEMSKRARALLNPQ